MLGMPMKTEEYEKAYATGHKVSNLAFVFNNFTQEKVLEYWEDENQHQVFKPSDNYAFFTELKIPAHSLSSFNFINFEFYHKAGGEIHLIDFDFTEDFIQAVISGTEGLAKEKENTVQLDKNSHQL